MSLILSGSDGLSDVDGSASTPAIRGTDANTGIFFPAADTIGFSEGGTEVLRVDSSGNLQLRSAGTSILNSSGNKILQQTGSVIQVVNANYSTETSSSSSTFADTGLTATITPTSSSSKILVFVNQAGCGKLTNNTFLYLRLLRDSTTISNFERVGGATGGTTQNYFGSCSVCYLDSPATTSAITYKTQLASQGNNATVRVNSSDGGTGSMSTITLVEIAA